MEEHGCITGSFRVIQHSKIIDRTGLFHRIIGERHILRCQRLSVRKLHIVPDLHRPGQAVFAGAVCGGQIIPDGQICICNCKRTLDQRLMNMFPCSPAVGRIKPCFRLGGRIHNNDNRAACFCLLPRTVTLRCAPRVILTS